MQTVRVAAAGHRIEAPGSWQAYADGVRAQVAEAVQAGAELLVFPEYGSLALVPLLEERDTLARQLLGLQAFAERFLALFRDLADHHACWIVAPSFPVAIAPGQYVNRAWITGPGRLYHQDKCHMTRFERELFDISPGEPLLVVDTGRFRFGVTICYDVEFPLQVHALVAAGAQIIAVPSCTDSLAGYHRVSHCARARAVENQCFVVQSPLLGEAPWCEAIDVSVGQPGVFSPVDRGFPEDGVLALGNGQPGWLYADCALDTQQAVRDDGQVFNLRDWQVPIAVPHKAGP